MIRPLQQLRILPEIQFSGCRICRDDWEAEGALLTIRWGPIVIQQFFGRIDRNFDNFAHTKENHDNVR